MKQFWPLAIFLCSVATVQSSSATEFVGPPPPDIRLSFVPNKTALAALNSLIKKFADRNHFIVRRNVPRAVGKFYFVGLSREDNTVLIVAEESSAGAPISIECTNVNGAAADFERVEAEFLEDLKQQWPNLKVTVFHHNLARDWQESR